MIEIFLADGCIPFSIALVLLLCIALLEVITSGTASAFLDSIIPDLDVLDAADALDATDAADVDVQVPVLTRLLGWIRVRNVPILVVLVCFLAIFSVSGYATQMISNSILKTYLPWYLAVLPALLISLPLVRGVSALLGKFVIRDESSAVTIDSLVSRIGHITTGTAKLQYPAEARVEDKYGQAHYVRVVPKKDEEITAGTQVVLVERTGQLFKVVRYDES